MSKIVHLTYTTDNGTVNSYIVLDEIIGYTQEVGGRYTVLLKNGQGYRIDAENVPSLDILLGVKNG